MILAFCMGVCYTIQKIPEIYRADVVHSSERLIKVDRKKQGILQHTAVVSFFNQNVVKTGGGARVKLPEIKPVKPVRNRQFGIL